MPDEAARLDALLADIEVDAASREMASLLYHAALAEGRSEDEALDLARDTLEGLRADWREAKTQDGD